MGQGSVVHVDQLRYIMLDIFGVLFGDLTHTTRVPSTVDNTMRVTSADGYRIGGNCGVAFNLERNIVLMGTWILFLGKTQLAIAQLHPGSARLQLPVNTQRGLWPPPFPPVT